MVPPTPDDLGAALLGDVFGSPSLVVATYLLVVSLWSWWSFARGAATTGARLFDRSNDAIGWRTLKVAASMRLVLGWAMLYGAASFVTQIWAGSRYSPGQGGGLAELLRWSAVFGVIAAVACLFLTPSEGPPRSDPKWAPFGGMGVGYGIGLVWASVAFTTRQDGPHPGDWWVCPALSAIGVAGACMRMRIRAASARTPRRTR